MSESYRALCNDFYINQKVSVKMDLPRTRETVLDLFERLRRQFPEMNSFRRYREELALESPTTDIPHRWVAVRNSTIRSGCVNAETLADGYALHKQVLEAVPPFLSISPLDIDFIEVLYGFDLAAGGNHDAIVLDALVAGTTLASLADIPGATAIDWQPVVGIALGQRGDLEAYFEVKTRSRAGAGRPEGPEGDPISVYLTLRKFGPFTDLKAMGDVFDGLADRAEDLIENHVLPGLLMPIREAIASGNA